MENQQYLLKSIADIMKFFICCGGGIKWLLFMWQVII